MCPSLTVQSHPPVPAASQPLASSAEPVEVRTAEVDGLDAPAQLLVSGRLWLVRDARRRHLAPDTGLEQWRVRAGDGASGSVTVFDLLRLRSGSWRLLRARG